ncbi:hypothetical protein LDENG_00175000 [Lucifuga dentata]|nr:hypothetical protein LDENG_00175000 [Lucifuga dentata]
MDPDLTIIILGNTGTGKSASGNTILGGKNFESRQSFKSVTQQISEKTEHVFGKRIAVVDTPGILCAEDDIRTCCHNVLQSSQPCLFLVVVKIDRFTDEQQKATEAAIRVLGAEGLEKSYLLFTSGDLLDNMSLEDFISESPEGPLPKLVKDFSEKYHLFNNMDEDRTQVKELLVKSGHLACEQPSEAAGPSDSPEDRRIVLLGLPGAGKSSSGNTILGSKAFQMGSNFGPVTKECDSASAIVDGRKVTVVDTPGFLDEVLSPKMLSYEIMKSITKASPGPHAFVIVMEIGRISKANIILFEVLTKLFGSEASKYAMILFTHGDKLGDTSLHDLIRENRQVSDLVDMYAGRYCDFDNKKQSRQQVGKFLHKIDDITKANEGQYYKFDMDRIGRTFTEEHNNQLTQRKPGGQPASKAPTKNASEALKRNTSEAPKGIDLESFLCNLWNSITFPDWFIRILESIRKIFSLLIPAMC